MKKHNVLIIVLLINSIQIFAQTYKPEYDSKKEKYGFVNDKGVIKNAIYEYAKPLNKQHSLVQLYDKAAGKSYYGIIDNTTLKPVIPITQEYITSSNYHVVVRNGTNNELYDLSLKKIGDVFKYVELPTNTMTEDAYTITARNNQDKYGVLNYKGEVILPFKYDYLRGIFNTDLYTVQENKNDPSVSIIDKKGVFQFAKKGLYMINDHNDNYFIAQLYIENKIENVLLDKKGNTILKLPNRADFLKSHPSSNPKFENCNLIDLESSDAYPNAKHSLLNIKGEELIASDKWYFSLLNCNLIKIQKDKGNGEYIFGVYDLEKKKMIVPIQYPKIELRENNTKIMAGTSRVYNIDVEYDLYDLSGNKISSYKK